MSEKKQEPQESEKEVWAWFRAIEREEQKRLIGLCSSRRVL